MPARGDDVVLFEDDTHTKEVSRLYFLRSRSRSVRARQHVLADFVSPKADWMAAARDGGPRHRAVIGALQGESRQLFRHHVKRWPTAWRGLRERLHERVRENAVGHAPDEALSNEEWCGEVCGIARRGLSACHHSQKPSCSGCSTPARTPASA